MSIVLGIDVGGTGLKAALVNTESGELIGTKIKRGTPQPSTPAVVVEELVSMIGELGYVGSVIGCGMPSIMKNNICLSAANIDKGWIDLNLNEYFKTRSGLDVQFINDADAAGLAEMIFGTGVGRMGTVVLLTLGTGIGSAVFLDGKLVPNTEFGHLLYKKSIFEHYASNGARERKNMSWKKWCKELNVYLNHINLLVSPDLIIIGGGISKRFDDFSPYINVNTEVQVAKMFNEAGIIGAAMHAAGYRL